MIALSTVFSSFLLAAQAPAPAPAPPPAPAPDDARIACAALRLPAFPVCRPTRRGVIFAATAEEAEAAAAAASEGEESFARHVGPVARYAVLVGADTREANALLRGAGYRIVLPWLSPAARQLARDESVRRATEAQLAGRGLTRDQTEAAVAQALAQARGPQQDRLMVSYAAVAHELGHLWLIETFWRDAAAAGGNAGHYGGPGPDWLDEAVAIAMEDEALTAPRRTRFRALVRGEAPGRLETLAAFFAMDHPLKGLGALVRSGALGAGAGRTGSGSAAIVLTGAEATRRLGVAPEAAPNFYAQARAVADFLIERSGRPQVLGEIAQALARGRTFEQWLGGPERPPGLGATMAELEEQWAAWTRTAYGAGPG